MELKEVDPNDLLPNPWNTNSVPPEAMEKLVASLKRHGFVKPVVCRDLDGDLQILGGEHRVLAARELGYTVPVAVLYNVSDEKAKEIGLIDNARYGEDDAYELSELLSELGGIQLMSEFLPFGEGEIAALSTNIDDDEIENLLSDEPEDTEIDDKPVKPTKTHQIMRFKVPVQDADAITDLIEKIMSDQSFDEADSLTNAGDALVWLAQEYSNV